jgi:hypothetical protein
MAPQSFDALQARQMLDERWDEVQALLSGHDPQHHDEDAAWDEGGAYAEQHDGEGGEGGEEVLAEAAGDAAAPAAEQSAEAAVDGGEEGAAVSLEAAAEASPDDQKAAEE